MVLPVPRADLGFIAGKFRVEYPKFVLLGATCNPKYPRLYGLWPRTTGECSTELQVLEGLGVSLETAEGLGFWV